MEIKSLRGMISAWPKTTGCIVGNVLCERFSYYGMRGLSKIMFSIICFDIKFCNEFE